MRFRFGRGDEVRLGSLRLEIRKLGPAASTETAGS